MRRRAFLVAAAAATALIAGAGSSRGVGSTTTISSGPVPTAGPTVIGAPAAGKRLTGLSGTWAGFGEITYHFQWYRCNAAGAACLSIHGATAPSYPIGTKDIGKTLGLTVSATDATGTASAYSSLVGPIEPERSLLESTAQPAITGVPVVGKTLQVSAGSWSPIPAKITYAWERCNENARVCAAIPRATRAAYTLAAADLGHTLIVVLQGTNGTTIQNAFSAATPPIVGPSVHGPAVAIGPAVAGEAVQGQQLSGSTGIWRGDGPIVFGFRWYRCNASGGQCATIDGATGATYTPSEKDIGATIAMTLRTTDSVGTSAAYASLVGPIAGEDTPLFATTVPTIVGVARVGGMLTVGNGLWSTAPTGYTYAWLRCNANGRICSAIAGATKPSYRPVAADAGHELVASVVASADGVTQTAFAPATAPIAP